MNNRRTKYLVDLTALELDGEIDAILAQAETDFKRRVLNGESPAQVRRGLVADAKQYSSQNYTGNFVGIKRKIHRMIADQEQRMVAKPVEDLKAERGQLYLWVRDPKASGCVDCLRFGKMPPRTKQGWLDLGRGLPRWGDTECNIGCKCMLRPVKRGQKVSSLSNAVFRGRGAGTQAEEILGVRDIRMQNVVHQQAKVAPRTTSYQDVNDRVIAVAQRNFKAEMEAHQTALEKPLTEGPKARRKSKIGKAHAKDRTSMEKSKVKKESDIKAGGVNESVILENGVKGVFKSHEAEYGMPKAKKSYSVGNQLRDGIKIGNQYKREVAFSILDEEMGLGLVPTTVMRKHKGKIGSFQRWKDGYMSSSDMQYYLSDRGIKNWRKLIKPRHAEGWYLIDSIGQNTDRHGGNWMAKPVKKQVKKKIDPRVQIRKDTDKEKEALKDNEQHLEIMEKRLVQGKDHLKDMKKGQTLWKKKIKDAEDKANKFAEQDNTDEWFKWSKRAQTYSDELRNVTMRIQSQTRNVFQRTEDVKSAKADVAKSKREIRKLNTKMKNAPAQKTITEEEWEVRIALIDNGLTLPTGHGSPSNGTPLTSYSGKRVSDYWMGKLKTMKQNEQFIRTRMKQESGMSDIAIDVFFTRLDRVLDTGVHLDSFYAKGFESDKYHNFAKGKYRKGSE